MKWLSLFNVAQNQILLDTFVNVTKHLVMQSIRRYLKNCYLNKMLECAFIYIFICFSYVPLKKNNEFINNETEKR